MSFPAYVQRFERRIVPALRTFAQSPPLLALRDALTWSFSGFVAGVIAIAVFAPGPLLQRVGTSVIPALGVMAAVLVVALPIALGRRTSIPALPLLVASLVAFALSLPRPLPEAPLPFARTLGMSGLFLAMVVVFGVFAAMLVGRRLRGNGGAWIGAAIALGAFSVPGFFGVSIGIVLIDALEPLGRLGDSYPALALIVLVESVLWLFGIHGPALLAAVVTPVYLTLQAQNSQAYVHGQPLPHIVTVSTFLFVFPGGAGATLPLALMLLRSTVVRARRVGRATLATSAFNVNEPLLFGLPLVLEPVFAVPFLLAPLLLATTTYVAMATNLVGRPIWYVPSSIPVFANVWIATLDWRGAVLMIVNLAIAGALWYPFVRLYERTRSTSESVGAAA